MNRQITRGIFYSIILVILSSVSLLAEDNFDNDIQAIITKSGGMDDAARLHKLFDVFWIHNMHEYPEWATYVGFPGQNDRWTDNSLEAVDKRNNDVLTLQKALHSIERTELNQENKLNYDLFETKLDDWIDGARFKSEYMSISSRGGVQQNAAQLLSDMPTTKVADCENILARLRGLPNVIKNDMALLQEGLKAGITLPRVTLVEIPQQVLNQIVDNPADAPLLTSLKELPPSISETEQTRIRTEAYKIYKDQIVPAFKELHSFLVQRYLVGSREEIGWSTLPGGTDWYTHLCKHYTTTNMTPDEIFNLGKSEVKRIRGEMDNVIEESGFDGDFAAFCDYLRNDPRFFYDEPDDLLSQYRNICKKADAQLIKLFGRLPRLPYGVEPVPSYSEKSQTTAYYNGGSLEAGRPGIFYANTYDLKSRPKWEMEPLSLHEAVPGHHLQISIAQELEGLPEFRKRGWFTAYGEGWGLYSESLGEEMGFYKDPYSKFGQLSYEMWRAIRLVVDVGMHVKGWSRQEAIDFFTKNIGKADHDIEVEIDRYISTPGQALAYKIGELKIKELRAFATKELGEKFDIRAFHDQVLGNGPVPLDVLESIIKEWVATQKTSS